MNCLTEELPLIAGERVRFTRIAQAEALLCDHHFRGARMEVLSVENGYVDVEIFACCPAFAECVRRELTRDR